MESRHITKQLNQVNTFEIKKVSYLVITVHKYTHEQYMHNIPARAKSKTTYIYPSSPIRTYFASNFIPSWGRFATTKIWNDFINSLKMVNISHHFSTCTEAVCCVFCIQIKIHCKSKYIVS